MLIHIIVARAWPSGLLVVRSRRLVVVLLLLFGNVPPHIINFLFI
jgi:hypothetical protein